MTKLLNHINTYADLTAFNNDMEKDYPNISYIKGTDEVKWNKYDPDHIVCVYNVTSTESATELLNRDFDITYQIIDGVRQDAVQKTYTFDTLGEHIVKYKLSGTSISNRMFDFCKALTSVIIPSGVTSIDSEAFSYSGLKRINISNTVTSISSNSFKNCYFDIITVDSSNTVYDSRNNCNAIIETATNTLLVGSKNTIIPNTVTSIGQKAFYAMRQSQLSIIIPDSVTTIADAAFQDSFGTIEVGRGVTSIGNETFAGILTTGAINKINFTIKATTPPTLGTGNFVKDFYSYVDYIYVPAESVDAYKTATNWSTYADRIQPIS